MAPQVFTFYLGGSTNPEYVTSTSTKAYLNWSDNDITHYCLTTGSDSTSCTWNEVTGTSIEVDYTLSSTDGTKTVYAYLKDAAGNISPQVSDSIILDTSSPSSNSISINNNDAYTTSANVTLTLSSSGASEMCISNTSTCTNWENYVTSKSHTLTTGLGSKTVYVTYKDAAGNISDAISDTISLYESLTIPSQSGSLTYTGSSQTPSWSNYNSSKMTISGTTNGTNAGSYNATFTPKTNYIWSDGTTGAKTVAWSIGKAAGSLSVSPTTLSLKPGGTGTITATRSGDGTVSATSSNTSVATVSVSGTTITVTAKASGSATITVKVEAGTNHSAPSNKTVSLTVTNPSLGQYIIDNSISGLDKTIIPGDTLYRFSGTSGNTGINNYICLGTSTKCSSGSDNMYRIIGVEPSTGYVKVIKQTIYGENIPWNSSAGATWPESDAYDAMTTWYNSVSFKSMIVSHSWGITDFTSAPTTRANAINAETKTSTTTAYVGMLAVSDYYLAYRGDQKWDSIYSNYISNWIHLENNGNTSNAEWTMSRCITDYFAGAWIVFASGGVGFNSMTATWAVRPAFYLNSTVNRISGSGTSDDPFIVG